MRAWQLFRQALENMGRARLRAALTALGVAIASGSIACMVGFVLGLQQQVETPFLKLGLLHNIDVRPGKPPEEQQQAEESSQPARGHILDDAAIARFESMEGVDYACPDFRLAQVELVHGDATQNVHAVGVPREMSLVAFFDELLKAGSFFSQSNEPEAIVSQRMVHRLKLGSAEEAVGQTVQIVAAGLAAKDQDEFSFRREKTDVRIVGVFQPPSFTSGLGDHALLLPVDVMRDLPGIMAETQLQQLRSQQSGTAGTYSRVTVRAEHPDQVPRIEQTIRDDGFRTHAMVTEMKEMRTVFIFLKLLLSSVGTVALIVAGLGILNTQLMTVMERRSEIGLYKAIGASDGDIRLLFLTEAGIVGLVGGLGGLLLARVVASLIQWAVGVYLSRQGLEEQMVFFHFPFWLLAGAVAYSVIVSMLSGLYPASRAASLDPIQALRAP